MASTKSKFDWDFKGFSNIFDGSRMRDKLTSVGNEGIRIAKEVYQVSSRHESSPPIKYLDSFRLKRSRMVQHWGPAHVTTVPTVQIVNTDPEWFFVEFGVGHGAHKPGYKYRVLGRTLDILGTRAVG